MTSLPLHEQDLHWMRRAVELAAKCPPSSTAYSVGAVIVGGDGVQLADGFSRESDPHFHAEETALAKLPVDDKRLLAATMYSTLEPCSQRSSRPHPCAQLILAAGIPRVVIAWREPPHLVANCIGVEQLLQAGVEVVELPEFAAEAKAPNLHIIGS
jgi:diaminohydroxyphosphoribosylaminopyrimidine deaminase/5-amino-6-(5-phosphoribosylamino)uracil reductase